MIVLLILKVPQRTILQGKARKKVLRTIYVTTILLIIPSLFFGVRLVEESNITGFEDEGIVQMQKLGDEVTILFPQIEALSSGAVYEYQDSQVVYTDKLTIHLNAPFADGQEENLQIWLVYARSSDLLQQLQPCSHFSFNATKAKTFFAISSCN